MNLTGAQIRRRQALSGLALGLLCWLLFSVAHVAGLLEPFDLRLLDLKFRLRGERPAPEAIAIVGVDDATIRGYGAWPLPRDSYALLIAALEEAGAKAIGMDLQFPSDRNQDPKWNVLLAHVSASQENVVHAIWLHAQGALPPGGDRSGAEATDALSRHGALADGIGAAAAASVALPFADLMLSSRSMGHITVAVDRDGSIRRVPLVVRYRDRVYPALAVALYGIEHGQSVPPTLHRSGRTLRIHWPKVPPIRGWVDREGSTPLDFAGDAGSFPNTHSMLEVLQWYQGGDSKRLRAAFEGRTVLVGLTSRQEASEDVGTTPFNAATPLLYVHANLLENLYRGRLLSRPPGTAYLGGLAIYAALLGWLITTVSLPTAGIVAAAATLVMALGIQAVFALGSLDVPPVACLALAPAVFGSAASYRYLFLERRSLRREAEIREGITIQQQFLPEALVGKRLGTYLIEERLGAGGMGVVYRARDEKSGADLAVKVLPGGALADEKTRRRFRHEALALSRLRHPNIAQLVGFDSQDGIDFMAMEFVRGTSLFERIRRGALPETEAARITLQVCDALEEAHRRGILHRDLKPANVMLADGGRVKLLDFGIARLGNLGATAATVTGNITEPGQVAGTFAYMAPEVLRGEPADERTDVYGVGMLLFEMATGQRPFPDDVAHELVYLILNQPPPRPSVLNSRVSRAVEELTLRMLSKIPSERPRGAAETRASLVGLLPDATVKEGSPC